MLHSSICTGSATPAQRPASQDLHETGLNTSDLRTVPASFSVPSCASLAALQEEALEAEVRSSIVSHMVMVHQSVRTFSARFQEQLRRSNYVTPKNYLDFIYNYKHALAENRTTFSGMAARLDGGLQKLIQVRV